MADAIDGPGVAHALDQAESVSCGTEDVVLTVGESIATIRLNRPDVLNAANRDLLEGLATALHEVEARPDLAVVVLTGTGRGFCAGGDVRAHPGAASKTAAEERARVRRVGETSERLYGLPQITIAAVNGACAGGGIPWAAACDLRLAADSAVFNTAYLTLGLPGDLGGAWLLTRAFGSSLALDWYLRPRRISSEEALAAGFVTMVAPASEFAESVRATAESLAAAPAATLRAVKANVRDAERLDLADYLDRETERHVDARMRGR